MAITLSNGVVIQDIPSAMLEAHPYLCILELSENDTSAYLLIGTDEPMGYWPVEIASAFVGSTTREYAAITVDYSWGMYATEGIYENVWYPEHMPGTYKDNVFILTQTAAQDNAMKAAFGDLTQVSYIEPVWSNHDIVTVTGADSSGNLTTGDVYFARSDIPPFVLPDGTELPALPAGCFETRPYGFVTKIENDGALLGCVLYTGFDIADYVETEFSGQTIRSLVCHATNFVSYEYEVGSDTTWKDGVEDTSGDGLMAMVGANGAFSIDVAWTNFDIFYLDHVDDNGDRVLSDTLYHRSDVNYRVYGGWLNSMGNQARRLGGVSGALMPGEMESVFSGATLEPLTVTPTTEEQTFTPESPCIGFSSVTVEAAPDTGGGDIVEPETYPDAENMNFGIAGDVADLYTGKYFYGTYDTAINLPDINTSVYSYLCLIVYNNTSTYLYATAHPQKRASGRHYFRKVYQSYSYSKSADEWTLVKEVNEDTGSYVYVTSPSIYWANHDVYNNSNSSNLVQEATEPVPETVEGVDVEYIDTAETYRISGATLNALGAVTQQITGIAATTPSAMVSALQMYAGTH